jgi:hypothetical protein
LKGLSAVQVLAISLCLLFLFASFLSFNNHSTRFRSGSARCHLGCLKSVELHTSLCNKFSNSEFTPTDLSVMHRYL